MVTLIKNSLANLKGHKLRLIIALIWIIIGITSVVFINSVGKGITELFKTNFESIKPRTTVIYYEYPNEGKDKSGMLAYQPPIMNSDVDIIRSIDGVSSVTTSNKKPSLFDSYANKFGYDVVFYGKSSYSTIAPYGEEKYKILKGRAIESNDDGSRVIVIPSKLSNEIFGKDVDPIGKGVTIKGLTFEVVGVSNSKFYYDKINKKFKKVDVFNSEFDTSIVPQSSYDILTGSNLKTGPINSLEIDVKEGANISKVSEKVVETLKDLHPKFNGNYMIQDRNTIQKKVDEFTHGIDKFVSVITVIAMIVGGVGIMNIMYVSVMERTKEIGIRRALGAKSHTILTQFLIESVFITSIGGLIGVVVGYAVTIKSQGILPFVPIPSFEGFIYALICIVITGIISGLVPAYRASKVDPIKVIYK